MVVVAVVIKVGAGVWTCECAAAAAAASEGQQRQGRSRSSSSKVRLVHAKAVCPWKARADVGEGGEGGLQLGDGGVRWQSLRTDKGKLGNGISDIQ